MRAPVSLRSRIIANSRSFDSTTSSLKLLSRASITGPRGSLANILATLSLTGCTPARGIDPDRAAVGRDRARVEDFEPVHLQQVRQAVERIVAQMLVIDGVVLQLV